MAESKRLRVLSYMCRDIPCDVFYFIRDVIEDATGLETDLICENRFSGPAPSRSDPFKDNLADVVIAHSTDYLRLRESKQENMELCGVAPVHKHKEAKGRPVYFSEIIVLSVNREKYKSLSELKGCSWAYSEDSSVSGNLAVLNHLRTTLGTNASFFGSIIHSGSHLNSIKMVRDVQVEAAAVDSTVLSSYIREHPEYADKFSSIVTIGPLPSYPILFNKTIPEKLKTKITEALRDVNTSDKWSSKMEELRLDSFAPVDPDLYRMEEKVTQGSKGMKINMAYY